ncbi:MAG: hypothetical protein ACKVS9_01605 [Phycisphaerae bacterium]
MTMTLTDAAPTPPSVIERSRFLVAAGLIAYGLHVVAGFTGLNAGWNHPAVLLAGGAAGIVGSIALVAVLFVGSIVAKLIAGRSDFSSLFALVGTALAFWAAPGGTMDDWLKRFHVNAGPPSGGAYSALLPDYLLLAGLLLGLLAILGQGSGAVARLRAGLGMDRDAATTQKHVLALIVCVLAAMVLLLILNGPKIAHTYRGQVFLAVFLSLAGGVYAANWVTGVRSFAAYWPAPIIAGVLGLIVAAARPGLPPPYDQVNIIPAWNAARPLPIEMVALGLLGVHWMVRTMNRGHHAESQP